MLPTLNCQVRFNGKIFRRSLTRKLKFALIANWAKDSRFDEIIFLTIVPFINSQHLQS